MFFFFFVPPTKKKNQKEKSSSQRTIRALRFSLTAGLSELGLLPIPQTGADKLLTAVNCDAH
ncbi:hypothetical protein HZA73_01385 [candidate division TA06 bacterium]|nr:hypothetical protein [candidate division TA06 bacterium]